MPSPPPFVSPAGNPRDQPVHQNQQLVLGQHVLPHDHRQPGAGLQAAVRDLPRLQDGRPTDVIHLPYVDQYE